MSPLLIAAIALLGIFLFAVMLAALSGKTEPDTERRRRASTRRLAEIIVSQYNTGALTYIHASYRLRELEIPADTRRRLLATRPTYARPPYPQH